MLRAILTDLANDRRQRVRALALAVLEDPQLDALPELGREIGNHPRRDDFMAACMGAYNANRD